MVVEGGGGLLCLFFIKLRINPVDHLNRTKIFAADAPNTQQGIEGKTGHSELSL